MSVKKVLSSVKLGVGWGGGGEGLPKSHSEREEESWKEGDAGLLRPGWVLAELQNPHIDTGVAVRRECEDNHFGKDI